MSSTSWLWIIVGVVGGALVVALAAWSVRRIRREIARRAHTKRSNAAWNERRERVFAEVTRDVLGDAETTPEVLAAVSAAHDRWDAHRDRFETDPRRVIREWMATRSLIPLNDWMRDRARAADQRARLEAGEVTEEAVAEYRDTVLAFACRLAFMEEDLRAEHEPLPGTTEHPLASGEDPEVLARLDELIARTEDRSLPRETRLIALDRFRGESRSARAEVPERTFEAMRARIDADLPDGTA